MEILLCMPKTPIIRPYWIIASVGLAYVSASLKKAGFRVHTINMYEENRSVFEAINDIMKKHDITAVGCGGSLGEDSYMNEIINAAKEIKPEVITFIGGPLVTYSPEEAMQIIPSADYGVIGEGEITTCELLSAIKTNKDISQVDSIIYRTKNEVTGKKLVQTRIRAELPDLDELPFPDYEAFCAEIMREYRAAGIITARSCPFRCTFCSNSSGITKYRQRSMDSIFSEIDFLVKSYGIQHLYLNDDLFSIQVSRLLEFCEKIRAYDLDWVVTLRVSSALTVEVLQKMKESRCIRVVYGLESADNDVLKCMDKKTTVEQMEQALINTRQAGINIAGNFIFGAENETLKTVNNTIQWVHNHTDIIGEVSFSPIRLFPGSIMYSHAVERGIIKDTVKHIKNNCPFVNVSKMTADEYDFLINKTLRDLNIEFEKKLDYNVKIGFILDKEAMSYAAKLQCFECGEIHYMNLPIQNYCVYIPDAFTIPSKENGTPCIHLGRTLLREWIKWVGQKLECVISNQRCAIWGLGWLFHYMQGHCDFLSKPECQYVLIDKSETKQRTIVSGKIVQSPDVLKYGDIDTVIISSTDYHNEIKEEILQNYPNITVYGLYGADGVTFI